ncbi:helix-turn-helix domain-containing protein [Paenibacillus terrae]|uniref:helix-turn-helix domain-containing protein n=1 Tax=Paenibacillus terrae TaxID=159743 RepID=UPI0006967144|nr:helix-turn-helix domain-containing protein [Paenibacillus terrae]
MIDHLFSLNLSKPIQMVYINNREDIIAMLPHPEHENERIILWPHAEKYVSTNTLIEPSEQQDAFDTNQLFNTAILLHHLFYNETLSLNKVKQDNENLNPSLISELIELKIIEQRENSDYHSSFLAERKIWEHLKTGNIEKMLYYMKLHSQEGNYGTLSKKDSLRNKKNLLITAVTLATRAAIEGGLYPEISYNLSDAYIQHIEELKKIDSITKMLEEILPDFAERVTKANRSSFSKTILLCQDYIFNHLHEHLTLESLAKQLRISPSYLSNKFKEETGETLKAYIQRQKIEEAKNLIVYSDLSISEIYSLLNFHDQSYFTKVFKKITGLTPKQYRNNLIIQQS